ncbi:TRAP transporter substrate-binding protein [Propionivibrio sp.]|uniref:TRAP transporter substrate-binding protein n=1 Tax=Propionivibrio sp. TaxID=2212460 RepID=UPI00272DCFC7|nr:TRAP transporter substrate-binding protein [Propionivibrio sp.]
MRFKRVLALGMLAGVFAIGAPVMAQEKAEVTLKAVTNNPKNSGHYRGLEIYKRMVEERTKGRVRVQLYSDAVLGDEEQMAEGMQMGTVDVMMAAAAKYANFVPEMDLYSPPYTFKSWDHLNAVQNSEVDATIAKKVKERRGDIYLGLFTDGARNVFTNKPVKTLDDLKGYKLRTMTGPNELAAWKAFGTNPTPLAYTELYSALQVGVVDGAENTMTSLLGMKFWESCKFVLRTEHSYLALPFFMSAKAVAKVPADLRETVIQAGRDTAKEQVKMAIRMDKESEETLKKNGVQVFEMSKEDKDKAIALMQPVLDANAKRIGMEKELAMIRELGKKF